MKNSELLQKKYLFKNESPNDFVHRVTNYLYPESSSKEKEEFFQAFDRLEFVPSSPTMYNAGLSVSQLSSCFVQHVDDNLYHIYESIKRQALLSKYAGGVAQNWTSVRGCGASLREDYGTSQGIIPFIKCVETTSVAVNQSGKRKGACCVYLEPWHVDIEDFICLRHETGVDMRRTHHLHTALWIPDLFMQRVEQRAPWVLFDPHEIGYVLNNCWGEEFEKRYVALESKKDSYVKSRTVDAWYLWRLMLSSLYETGHPWLCFKDT